ncbi:hypothetical protein DSM112329_00514 [Paraconexibacter sp. AEG42_29]|uniref:Calx-beta domain-containing protein n=1 Tax=Paraconexibacter sp. AEG42_29 TaxID=2997339 RepID=A0AAU7APZ9_9ACTN
MQTRSRIRRAAATAALVTSGVLLAAPGQALAESAFAVDGANNLYTFDTKTPGTLSAALPVTGLGAGTLEAIDVRPATGELYGLVRTATSTVQLVRVPKGGGAAVPVGATFALTGVVTGFDFNPTVDRIRIATGDDENRRVAPLTGTVTTDGAINPTSDVIAAAYTNNVSGALSTRLYYIDFNGGPARLQLSGDPNAGTVTNVGSLGATLNNGDAGFDVSGATGIAYASVQATAGVATLHTINLDTGAASTGTAFAGVTDIVDIAVDTAPPAIGGLAAEKAFVVTGTAAAPTLQTLQTNAPQTLTSVGALGLPAGETFAGLDAQPSSGRLFLITKDAANAGRVYTVNKGTGGLTLVTTTPFALDAATAYAVDFNPVPNAIRVISNLGLNLRISPVTGNQAAADTALTGTPAPNIVGAAYDNNVNGAQQSTLYDIDATGDSLRIQGSPGGSPDSPNGGVVNNFGAGAPFGTLGIDTNTQVGFDISGATGIGWATLQPSAGASRLHRIDLATGRAGAGAPIGAAATDVLDVTLDVQPPSVQFSAAAFSTNEKTGTATLTISRSGNTDGTSTVSYATTATGTATAGTDFTAVAATPVTFAAGETSKAVDIVVADDTVVEDTETIGVTLVAGSNTGASLGAPNAATVSVFDNDPTGATVPVPVPGPTVTVPGPTVTVPGPTTNKPPVAVSARSATAKVNTTRDRRGPYSFRVSGSVTPPSGLSKSTACRYGTVSMVVKPTSGSSKTFEKRVSSSCTFAATVPVSKKGSYTITVRFLGSDRLKARSVKTLKVRAG